ncbi:MAG: hypothetical protein KatS3mg010_0329 [Acidimicrobiia bacterium]|nr:MAG: hypothetical protein KatS3mg010_0329 [Acidimicrobiia bacterium]
MPRAPPLGALGVLALVWMTIPSLATASGWPARVARDSAVVATLDRLAPEQPEQFAAWDARSRMRRTRRRSVRSTNRPTPGAPPRIALPAAVDATVRRSVVKVVAGPADRSRREAVG